MKEKRLDFTVRLCCFEPILFIDLDGREITITGEDGVTITYVSGGKYEGKDSFTMKMWSQLDEIYRILNFWRR